jgi:transposase
MDNASFHRTKKIQRMCFDSGIKLIYLPPYSPDLNPIEEFSDELKRKWKEYEVNPNQGFDVLS